MRANEWTREFYRQVSCPEFGLFSQKRTDKTYQLIIILLLVDDLINKKGELNGSPFLYQPLWCPT